MERYRNRFLVALIFFAWLVGCKGTCLDSSHSMASVDLEPIPHVVTSGIQQAIEKYIQKQTHLGGGYFIIPFQGQQLKLKFLQVHMEYLANLDVGRHLACVDLVSVEGDVYDVDFFLSGDPNEISVTKVTVHKINGQPYYVWKQMLDKTWRRAPVESASRHHLGVITGSDAFEFLYQAQLPEMNQNSQMWIPLPTSGNFQTVRINSIVAPGRHEILRDKEYGNKVLYLSLKPKDSGKTVSIRFATKRSEKSFYLDNTSPADQFLSPRQFVSENNDFQTIANQIVEGKKSDLSRARALYDHVIERMRYAKFGTGWGKGDAVYACNQRKGNCTDYHSYFIAIARASGIPSRFAIGAAIPANRDEGAISGYHCWAEFYAEGKWWPIDVSEADKHKELEPYYFGHHPANRVEFTRGRDLVVDPGPKSGPINFLAYPVLEVGGRLVKIKPIFSFKRYTGRDG